MASARDRGSDADRFERAVDAVVDGDVSTLAALLQQDPGLVHARSTRVTDRVPPVHGATLLHYVAANGIEDERQRSPGNAPAIAKMLLEAGADPNALCDAYESRCTTLSLLVSSTPPAKAGVQIPVMHVLIDHGALVTPAGEGQWTSPLMTALVFGFADTARALVDRGAPVDTLATCAGLGRFDDVRRMLPQATADDRHRALSLAAQLGFPEIVRLLIESGEDPNRFNLPGMHAHSTPLHQTIAAGHLDVVMVLIEHGARVDITDTIHHATPLGWAEYCGQDEIASYLRSKSAAG